MDVSIVEEGKKLVRSSVSEFGLIRNLKVASSLIPSWKSVRTLGDTGLFCNKFDFNGISCCIISKDLNFYEKPKASRSEKSEAIYLAENDNNTESYLLQYLPPHSATSRHYHKITTERFHNLEGYCIVEVEEDLIQINGETFEVGAGCVHQIKTGENPALTLIEMIGNPNGLSMDDHYYV